MLELVAVNKSFGGLRALDGLSFTVAAAEILGMIGPNGSGKSTAFNIITGTLRSDAGSVIFNGEDITGLRPHQISHHGIARTFQVVKPFPQLSAVENVLVGGLYGGAGSTRTKAAVAEAMEVLERVGLAGKADVQSGVIHHRGEKVAGGGTCAGHPAEAASSRRVHGGPEPEGDPECGRSRQVDQGHRCHDRVGGARDQGDHRCLRPGGGSGRRQKAGGGIRLRRSSTTVRSSMPIWEAVMLRVEDLEVAYGDLQVVWGVSFAVPDRSIVTILGPNGAGKTTTLLALMGLLPVVAGSVTFNGDSLIGLPTHRMVERGLVLIPEERAAFASLTVEENLELGAYTSRLRSPRQEAMAEILDIFPQLAERKSQLAGTLSGGERQMLAIGKALMARPELLILDEPSLGLAPIIVEHIFEVVGQIRDRGVSVLMVEQHVEMALEIADYAYVLETGSIVADGSSSELSADPRVQEAYLSL